MAISLPVSNYFLDTSSALQWVSVALALVVVLRHKSNISRLIKGEKNRFEKKQNVSGNNE